MSLVDHTSGTSGAVSSGQGDAHTSTPLSGGTGASGATPDSSNPAAPEASAPKKRRVQKTPDELARDAEAAFNARQEEQRRQHDKRLAKLRREAIPLSQRKANALALFDALRDAIIKSDPKHELSSDSIFEDLIKAAVLPAYPVAEVQPNGVFSAGSSSPGSPADSPAPSADPSNGARDEQRELAAAAA